MAQPARAHPDAEYACPPSLLTSCSGGGHACRAAWAERDTSSEDEDGDARRKAADHPGGRGACMHTLGSHPRPL
eukprot:363271-Amphidinium_carterae.1